MNGLFTPKGSDLNYSVTKPEEIKSLVTQLSISGLCFIINHTWGREANALAQGTGFQSVLTSCFLSRPLFSYKGIASASEAALLLACVGPLSCG